MNGFRLKDEKTVWEEVKGPLPGSSPVICLCTDCWLQPLMAGVVFVQPATYFALRAVECRAALLQWERGRNAAKSEEMKMQRGAVVER